MVSFHHTSRTQIVALVGFSVFPGQTHTNNSAAIFLCVTYIADENSNKRKHCSLGQTIMKVRCLYIRSRTYAHRAAFGRLTAAACAACGLHADLPRKYCSGQRREPHKFLRLERSCGELSDRVVADGSMTVHWEYATHNAHEKKLRCAGCEIMNAGQLWV